MSTKTESEQTLSKVIAGEDLRVGDYVSIFNQTYNFPSFYWPCSDHRLAPEDVVKLTMIPWNAGEPLHIVGISLPFIYAENPNRSIQTIDTRRMQVVRLAPQAGANMWKKMQNGGAGRKGSKSKRAGNKKK